MSISYTIRMPQDEGIKYEQIHYPGGEYQIRFSTDKQVLDILRTTDKIKVVASIHDGNVMQLALLTDALNELAPNTHKTLVLPYLPYARADRRFELGDCFGAKVFAKIINSLKYDKVFALDVHSYNALALFDNMVNIEPTSRILEIIDKLPVSILFPDDGAVNRYRALLMYDKIHKFACSKIRDPHTGKLSGFKIPEYSMGGSGCLLKNRQDFLIVDDICDGGGTFAGIAELMPKDSNLYLYVTHGIFSKGLEPLNRFKHIYTTDTMGGVSKVNLTVTKSGLFE